jgi:CYTH domain-containing protein
MSIEIERRYLVVGHGWRDQAVRARHLRDGLLAHTGDTKVRVRIEGERAWLTVKGPRAGPSRLEFEYEIPHPEAEDMLERLCGGAVAQKTRHLAPYGGLTWEIDVYEGLLEGVVLAEVELPHPDAIVARPPWLGREVTGEPAYRKLALLARCSELGGREADAA